MKYHLQWIMLVRSSDPLHKTCPLFMISFTHQPIHILNIFCAGGRKQEWSN